MKKNNKWLKEGSQSKITPKIKKISSNFKGNDFEKISAVLEWIENNVKTERNHDKVLKIFATRTAEEIINSKKDTGCHDTTVLLVTFLRAVNIPARYLLGIDKEQPKNGGHTVGEAYVNNNWILIDPSYWRLDLKPSRSIFYKENYLIRKGLDSWDCGVKTVHDWHKISDNLVQKINKSTRAK